MDGKANRLAALIRANLGMAMQGLAVVPLFAGYDLTRTRAGSSATTSPAVATRRPRSTRSAPARCSPAASLKKLYRDDLAETRCVTAAHPGAVRRRRRRLRHRRPRPHPADLPGRHVITAEGGRRMADDEVADDRRPVIAGRMQRPDGPARPP